MAESFGSSTTVHYSGGSGAGAHTPTLTKPASTAAGDWLIAIIYGNNLGTIGLGTTGFTTVVEAAPGNGQIWVGLKKAGVSEPSTCVFSAPSGAFVVAAMLRYTGTWGIMAVDVYADAANTGTSIDAPSIAPVGTADILICAFASADGAAESSGPAGMTLRAQDISAGNQGLSIYDKQLSSSGATGTQSDILATSDGWLSFAICVREGPPAEVATRSRSWSASASATVPTDTPSGTGYEINGRTRDWQALATVEPAHATAPVLPSYGPVFPVPFMSAGQPYGSNVLTPWLPISENHSKWGSLDLIIDGKNVTSFRTDNDGNPVWTHVLKWTDKSPGGDDLLDLWFPAITARDNLGSGSLSWFAPDRHVTLRRLHADGVTLTTVYEGVTGPWEDRTTASASSGDPDSQLVLHCVGVWSDLDRFITLPRPSIDQWIEPIPNGHLAPVDPGQLIYAQIHRARLYGWSGRMRRPDPTGIEPTGEQCSYGVPLASQTVQSILATMQTATVRKTIINVRPRGLKLDDLSWDGTSFDFSFHCMQPGVTHELTLDPAQAYNAIYGHGQAPFGPVDTSIGRPDAVADWMNWQYPIAPLNPPDYPLPPGEDFVAGDGHNGFQPFSDELRAHGYDLDSQDTYLTGDVDLIRQFQDNSGAQVDGIVGPQTWGQAFQISVNAKALAQSYIKELVAGNAQMPFLLNARGGILSPNPRFDPLHHPRREMLEEFGPLRKKVAVKSATDEQHRIRSPIYRGTVTATNVDPPEMSSLSTRSGMSMKLKGHAGEDRILFVAQVERVPGDQMGESRSVTWTVSEQPEGLMTLAQRLARNLGIKDLIASNRPPRHHAKQINSFPDFDAESGAGIFLPGQGQTGGLWSKYLIPMGGQCDVSAVQINADVDTKMAAAMFANPYLTIEHLIALPGLANPSVGTVDPWAKNATALENLGICWALGNPTAMGGYWPNDTGRGSLTGVLADLSPWQFRANSTYGALFVWTHDDCGVSGDPAAGYRAIFPAPV